MISAEGNQLQVLTHGEIKNPVQVLPSRCLVKIGDTLRALLVQYQPEVVAIEGLVYVQNTRIAFTLGEVRGVVIAAAAAHGLEIYEYPPRKVKLAVTGQGGAGKNQVANMVKALLGLSIKPGQDESDALAIAICHAQSYRGVVVQARKPI